MAGRPVSWLAGPGDVPAVLALLVMATITVADVDWLAAADRALEVRTLRAIGWPTSRVARLVAREAALLGIVGGMTAGVLDVVGCLAVAHQVPGRVLTAAAVAAGSGLLLSLVAAGLSAVIGRTASVIGLRHESSPRRERRALLRAVKGRNAQFKSSSVLSSRVVQRRMDHDSVLVVVR